MLVRDRMTRKVVTTTPQTTLSEARALLARQRIRQLPVLKQDRLAGMVTDRDLRSAPASAKTVKDVMTAKPFVISPDAAVDEAARLLRTYKIGALPVVEQNSLCGILTASDVLDAFVDLSGVTEPTYRVVLTGRKGRQAESRIRRIVDHCHGELKWIHQQQSKGISTVHLRLKTTRVDDIVTEPEAAGFDVVRVVAPSRKR